MNRTIFKVLVLSGLVVSLRLVFLCATVPPQNHNPKSTPILGLPGGFFFGPGEVKGRLISRLLNTFSHKIVASGHTGFKAARFSITGNFKHYHASSTIGE